MTWTDIIKKALDEAEKGGFEYNRDKIHWGQMTTDEGYYKLIFNHAFMKAIFGNGEHYDRLFEVEKKAAEEENREPQYEFLPLPLYKSMLQQMAIAEEPLQWLNSAIDNKTNLENLGDGVVAGTKDTSAIRERLKQQFKNSL
jgi:hypothetical protein